MSSTDDFPCIDVLLAEQPWLRRLAGALTRDAAAAEDLTQETWVTALTAPPRAPTRAWLRKVFQSRLYDDNRGRRRRQAREHAVFESSTQQVATPEEITARMEMLRKLAGHMLTLDENLRQVLYLRYVEDLEPIEVARQLGIPDGTVRWRMKQGLDQLRARLDTDTGGGRGRWLAVLAPLGRPERRSAPVRPGLSWTASFATVVGFIAVGLMLAQWRCSTSQPADGPEPKQDDDNHPSAQQMAAAAARPAEPGGAQVDAESACPCPEAEALEAERDTLARATEGARTLAKDAFLTSAPNPAVDPRLTEAVAALIDKAGKCGHSLECRGQVCRISLLVPESMTKVKGWLAFECFDAAGWDRVFPWLRGLPQHEYAGFSFDPVSRTGFKKVDLYYWLAGDGAAPEAAHPKLPPGWDRERGPIPADLAPACRARVVRIQGELAALVRQVSRTMYVNEVFEQSTPRPELARELATLLRPYLAPQGRPLPVEVECRGIVCTLRPRNDVPGSAVNWRCMSSGKPGWSNCWARWDDDGWFARLVKARLQLPLENLVPPREHEGQSMPAFLIFRPGAERQGVSGDWWVQNLVQTLDYAAIVTACERRHPAQGSLTLMAKVPETCGLADKPTEPLITVQYGGELINSALADCLREAIAQALDRLEPPACTFAWLHEWRLDFPHPSLELKASDEE